MGNILNRNYVIEISSSSSAFFGNQRPWHAQEIQIFNGFAAHVERGNLPWAWVTLHILSGYSKNAKPWLPGPSLCAVFAGSNLEWVGLLLFTIKVMISPKLHVPPLIKHPSWVLGIAPMGLGENGGVDTNVKLWLLLLLWVIKAFSLIQESHFFFSASIHEVVNPRSSTVSDSISCFPSSLQHRRFWFRIKSDTDE